MRSISTRCRSRTSPSRSACRCACPPVKPRAGSGESQIGDIGRGSGRRSYRQQPWLSSLSVPQAPCARNPRRCQVLLTDRPECARARWTAIPYPGPLSGKRPRRARRTRVSGRSAPDRVVRVVGREGASGRLRRGSRSNPPADGVLPSSPTEIAIREEAGAQR